MEKRVGKKLNAVNGGHGNPSCSRILIKCESKASLSCAAAAYLAKKLCRAAAVSVVKPASQSQRSRVRQPNTAVIMPKCADEAATSFLEKVTGGSINSSRNTAATAAGGAINIFESVTEKELELYAAIKKIKYTKGKSIDLKQKLQKFQIRYPGTIEALAQASRQAEEAWLKQA